MGKRLITYLTAAYIATAGISGCAKHTNTYRSTPRNLSELRVLIEARENTSKFYSPKNYKTSIKSLERIPNAPHYNNIKKLHCSKYAITAAQKEFGISYIRGNAWDLGHRNQVLYSNLNKKKLEKLLDKGAIPKGTVVTFYNSHSNSNFNNIVNGRLVPCKDKNGKKERCRNEQGNFRENTHAQTYAGKDNRGHIFWHQYDEATKTTVFKNTPNYLSPVKALKGKRIKNFKKKSSNFHTVKKGDSYSQIARKYDIGLLKLMKANNCPNIKHKCTNLKPRDRIRIPNS